MGSQSILGGHGGYIVKEVIKEPLSHFLKETPGYNTAIKHSLAQPPFDLDYVS